MSHKLRDGFSSLGVIGNFVLISMKLGDEDVEALLGWYKECMRHETRKQ